MILSNGLRFVFFASLTMSFNVLSSTYYPITVSSCKREITFNKMPTRAVFNDLNMTQMAFALDLQPNIIAVTGISGWYKTTSKFKKELGSIPEISSRYLTLEPLLSVNPDFLFAGWNYGLKVGSELTPKNLDRFGIQTLVLSESCAHIDKDRPIATMSLLYTDILKLGKIFDKQEKAESLVHYWQQELSEITKKVSSYSKKKVFIYDSGIDKPFTSGRFAMPEALINASGGINVMTDSYFSWGTTSWESVAVNNPDLIILVDYGSEGAMGAKQLNKILRNHPLMKETKAVKNNNFLLLKYGEITPGPNNINAIKKIASKLYPQAGINVNAEN